jgi:hypothetical protein
MSRSETEKIMGSDLPQKETNKMTVIELIAELERLVAEGHGNAEVLAEHEAVEEAVYIERLDEVRL